MNSRGITLIELVAAMAIFALVAIMGLQSLGGTLRAREAVDASYQDVTALTKPAALLRNDLSALVPVLFHPPGDSAPRSSLWLGDDGTVLGLSIAGQTDLAVGGGVRMDQLHRAIWRVDPQKQTLIRSSWRTLTPAGPAAATPEVRVMTGVVALRVRSFWPRAGWQNGVQPARSGNPQTLDEDRNAIVVTLMDTLPDAIEVTLVLEDGREIPVLETLQ